MRPTILERKSTPRRAERFRKKALRDSLEMPRAPMGGDDGRIFTRAAMLGLERSPWRSSAEARLGGGWYTVTSLALALETLGIANAETARRWFLMAVTRSVQDTGIAWQDRLEWLLEDEPSLALQSAWVLTRYAAQWSDRDYEMYAPVLDAVYGVLLEPNDPEFRALARQAANVARLAYEAPKPPPMPTKAPPKPAPRGGPAPRDAGMAAWLAAPSAKPKAAPAVAPARSFSNESSRTLFQAVLRLADAAIYTDPYDRIDNSKKALDVAVNAITLRPTAGWGRADDEDEIQAEIREELLRGLLETAPPIVPRSIAIRNR